MESRVISIHHTACILCIQQRPKACCSQLLLTRSLHASLLYIQTRQDCSSPQFDLHSLENAVVCDAVVLTPNVGLCIRFVSTCKIVSGLCLSQCPGQVLGLYCRSMVFAKLQPQSNYRG